ILQVSRIKAFGEPMVDWCQEVMGFLAFALLLPESSETYCCTEFPGFGLLVLGYTDGLRETRFRFSLIVCMLLQEEFAFEAIQLWFVPPFSCGICQCQCFRHHRQSCCWFPYRSLCFCEER